MNETINLVAANCSMEVIRIPGRNQPPLVTYRVGGIKVSRGDFMAAVALERMGFAEAEHCRS